MSAPLLQVRSLDVAFATARGTIKAVDGVAFDVEAGEVLGIVGESGSGKSVTLRAILGLLHANAHCTGSVLWRGEDLLGMSPERLQSIRGGGIAIVFQEPMTALNPVLPIGVQIDESLATHTDLDAGARRKRALELLDLVGIAAGAQRLGQYPHEFSGGMRQRAMLAIALAPGPALLLADEPTTALDVTIQDQILKLLLRLSDDLGMALVLVTHDLGVIAETCDRVAVMYAGRVCEVGPVERIFKQPAHAYTDALLRSVPGAAPPRTRLAPIPGQPPSLAARPMGCAFAPRCSHVQEICTKRLPPSVAQAPGHTSACFAAGQLTGTVRA